MSKKEVCWIIIIILLMNTPKMHSSVETKTIKPAISIGLSPLLLRREIQRQLVENVKVELPGNSNLLESLQSTIDESTIARAIMWGFGADKEEEEKEEKEEEETADSKSQESGGFFGSLWSGLGSAVKAVKDVSVQAAGGIIQTIAPQASESYQRLGELGKLIRNSHMHLGKTDLKNISMGPPSIHCDQEGKECSLKLEINSFKVENNFTLNGINYKNVGINVNSPKSGDKISLTYPFHPFATEGGSTKEFLGSPKINIPGDMGMSFSNDYKTSQCNAEDIIDCTPQECCKTKECKTDQLVSCDQSKCCEKGKKQLDVINKAIFTIFNKDESSVLGVRRNLVKWLGGSFGASAVSDVASTTIGDGMTQLHQKVENLQGMMQEGVVRVGQSFQNSANSSNVDDYYRGLIQTKLNRVLQMPDSDVERREQMIRSIEMDLSYLSPFIYQKEAAIILTPIDQLIEKSHCEANPLEKKYKKVCSKLLGYKEKVESLSIQHISTLLAPLIVDGQIAPRNYKKIKKYFEELKINIKKIPYFRSQKEKDDLLNFIRDQFFSVVGAEKLAERTDESLHKIEKEIITILLTTKVEESDGRVEWQINLDRKKSDVLEELENLMSSSSQLSAIKIRKIKQKIYSIKEELQLRYPIARFNEEWLSFLGNIKNVCTSNKCTSLYNTLVSESQNNLIEILSKGIFENEQNISKFCECKTTATSCDKKGYKRSKREFRDTLRTYRQGFNQLLKHSSDLSDKEELEKFHTKIVETIKKVKCDKLSQCKICKAIQETADKIRSDLDEHERVSWPGIREVLDPNVEAVLMANGSFSVVGNMFSGDQCSQQAIGLTYHHEEGCTIPIELNLESLNAQMATMFSKIVDANGQSRLKKLIMLDGSTNITSNNHVELSIQNAPQLKWDPIKKGLYLDIPNISVKVYVGMNRKRRVLDKAFDIQAYFSLQRALGEEGTEKRKFNFDFHGISLNSHDKGASSEKEVDSEDSEEMTQIDQSIRNLLSNIDSQGPQDDSIRQKVRNLFQKFTPTEYIKHKIQSTIHDSLLMMTDSAMNLSTLQSLDQFDISKIQQNDEGIKICIEPKDPIPQL